MAFLLFACGVGILFFALVQLIAGSSQPLRNCMLIACFSSGYIILYLWAAATGSLLQVPVLANSDVAAKYPAIAAFYLSALTILHEGRRPVRSYLAYFAAPVLLAACIALYGALVAPDFLRKHATLPGHYANPFFMTLTLLGDILWLSACLLNLLVARRLYRARQVRDIGGFRHQVVFLFAYFAAAIFLVVASALRNERLYTIACLATGTIIVCFALSRTAVFYLGHDLLSPRLRQRKPQWDRSAQDLDARLSSLMEQEAPYKDETISLKRVASMLSVEPKRLSYHLNLHNAKSFRSYINELRLAAVCRDLVADPAGSILDTALANGFNSKSSFNALFFKVYGTTPKEFRRANARQ
jgi:AraC-like DNA-binding protein